MSMETFQDYLDVALGCIEFVGVPVAITLFYRAKRREQRDREYGTYDALDDGYTAYLQLALDNPDLDVADTPLPQPVAQAPERDHRELIVFSVLLSLLERAFLMYADKSDSVRQQQWSGWETYIHAWCGRENFRRMWGVQGNGYDGRFTSYMKSRLAEALRV